MIVTIILALIFLFCVGFLFAEGMWSNALRFITVVAAALLATNYFEPVAEQLDAWQPTYTYCWDFLALWGLFAVFASLFRAMTDQLSKVKLRFPKNIDQVGGIVFSALVGWVMVCFTLTTLHTAPLGEKFFYGSFQADKPMFFWCLSPDKQWLSFVKATSKGALQRDPQTVFSPGGTFLKDYNERRKQVEAHVVKLGTIRLGEGEKPPPLPSSSAP
jgi:uncharacterized membrane protein required for colicin V production